MLPQNVLVALRKGIEDQYDGLCTIYENVKVVKPNKSTGYTETIIFTDKQCRLSFKTITSTNPTENASIVKQITKLFIAPEAAIKPGSKIVVTQNGITTSYKQSGKPAIYETHQEIILELFDGYA